MLCLLAEHLNRCVVLIQPGKRSNMTEKNIIDYDSNKHNTPSKFRVYYYIDLDARNPDFAD